MQLSNKMCYKDTVFLFYASIMPPSPKGHEYLSFCILYKEKEVEDFEDLT